MSYLNIKLSIQFQHFWVNIQSRPLFQTIAEKCQYQLRAGFIVTKVAKFYTIVIQEDDMMLTLKCAGTEHQYQVFFRCRWTAESPPEELSHQGTMHLYTGLLSPVSPYGGHTGSSVWSAWLCVILEIPPRDWGVQILPWLIRVQESLWYRCISVWMSYAWGHVSTHSSSLSCHVNCTLCVCVCKHM